MQFVNAMNALEISLRWPRIEDKFEEILILLRASDIFATLLHEAGYQMIFARLEYLQIDSNLFSNGQ